MLNCVVCNAPLSGKQTKYCSNSCKNLFHTSYPKQQARGKSRKSRLIEMSGGCCSRCGYNKCMAALHFHHIDPSLKSFTLDSRNISNRTWEAVLGEFKKCTLLCANCHAELHSSDH